MKKLLGALGTFLFWALWPVWFVYFRVTGVRSRVMVVYEGEILLLQGWLSTKDFHLPGGGAKRHETPAAAAVRELEEETGITLMENSLKRVGFFRHSQYGLQYNARIFSVELSSKPEVKLRHIEIWNALWVNLDEVEKINLNIDTIYALKRYRPSEQARLL